MLFSNNILRRYRKMKKIIIIGIVIIAISVIIFNFISHELNLIEAVKNENEKQVKKIINSGVDVNQNNNLPLLTAVNNGNKKITRLLIEAGANIKQTNNKEETALDLAREKENRNIIKLLKNR